MRQYRELYRLSDNADWSLILEKRTALLDEDLDGLVGSCLAGTETILVDDGIDEGDMEPYTWFNKFTRSPCKRILRIESTADNILASLHVENQLPTTAAELTSDEAYRCAWTAFTAAFDQAITDALQDAEVVRFKSIICYRTGLNVDCNSNMTVDGFSGFRDEYLPTCVGDEFEIHSKRMSDALLVHSCKLIASSQVAKPLQIHTRLGDNSFSGMQSNPAYLRPLIAAFPAMPIVLLHLFYPYTREAGYLASVYKNCFLDIGLVFSELSWDGQDRVLRQSLEMTPWSKILWSTDGNCLPETYWFANKQGRTAMEKVFCEYVQHDDLSVSESVQAAKHILFQNSNKLYKLGLQLDSTTMS